MDTAVRTPLEIFNLPQHLVIPLFQRPYVWSEENQWQPLWQDIRRLAEHRLAQPASTATHFLGAVVLQASENQAGTLQPRAIIDGQQRLTTLQLLLDATAAIFEARDLSHLAGQIEGLTHNATHFVQTQEDALKLRHTNRDRLAYDEVMDADPPVDYAGLVHATSLIVRAHQFFSERVEEWLGQGDDPAVAAKADVLTVVLSRALQLVVIDLRSDENSQEIFETLNARGTPLTAADLIKNFVFQRLQLEGVDTAKAYEEQWPFDAPFWEKEISVGRYPITRSSLFLNQWLISRVGEEIGPTSTFSRFKYYVEREAGQPMATLLDRVKEQASAYQNWTERAADSHGPLSRVELCVYRTQAVETESIKPVLIWLHEPGANRSTEAIERVVALVESWVLRRALLRLTLSDLTRVVADLIKTHRDLPDFDLPARIERFLSRQGSESTYWPSDGELRDGLVNEAVYRRFKRGRLRMFLETAEDHLRGYNSPRPSMTGTRVSRGIYPIEHLLPQKWKDHWPVDDLAAEVDRDAHVHRLGNLTLVTASLNSSVSNGAWLGAKGKRAKLHDHDVFLMNRQVYDSAEDGWDESLIDQRTSQLTEALIATWPVPEGHVGKVATTRPRETSSASLRDLVAVGLIAPGTQLRARSGEWGGATCVVTTEGNLTMDGKDFTSPSAAGHHLRKAATNGWWFWHLPDGRRLKDVRNDFQGPGSAAERDDDQPSAALSVKERAIAAVRDEIARRGGQSRVEKYGNRKVILATGPGSSDEVALLVRSRTSGDWQTSTTYGEERTAELAPTRFWIMVDLLRDGTNFYVVPEWWIANDIHRHHQAYLDRSGGHRAVNDDSTHHSIQTHRVEHWLERWDQIPIFGATTPGS